MVLGTRWVALWACSTLLGGCAPNSFDKYVAGSGATRDAAHGSRDADVGGAHDAGLDGALPPRESELLDGSFAPGGGGARDAELPRELDGAGRPDDAGPLDGGLPVGDAGRCPNRIAHPLAVAGSVIPLARLRVPASLRGRVLGPSAWLGAHRTWVTSANGVAQGFAAPAGVSNVFPLAGFDGNTPWLRETANDVPWQLDEQSTDLAIGTPMLPLSASEVMEQASLFPSSLIRRGDSAPGGLLFVLRHGFFAAPNEVWLAEIEDHAALATRATQPLFSTPPLFAHGAFRGREYVKVFACNRLSLDPPIQPECVVARVPNALVDRASAYEVYIGEGNWSKDLTAGVPVLDMVADSLTVSWNAHLQAFLAVHSAPLTSDIVLRSAASVEGPWSAPVRVPIVPAAMPWVSDVREHESVVQQCGKRLIVSYWMPTAVFPNGLPSAGEMHLVAIDLE
jgi:hypothetical protein